jgi:hypothetical protein
MWVWGKRVTRMGDPWSQRWEGSRPRDLLFSKPDRLEGRLVSAREIPVRGARGRAPSLTWSRLSRDRCPDFISVGSFMGRLVGRIVILRKPLSGHRIKKV